MFCEKNKCFVNVLHKCFEIFLQKRKTGVCFYLIYVHAKLVTYILHFLFCLFEIHKSTSTSTRLPSYRVDSFFFLLYPLLPFIYFFTLSCGYSFFNALMKASVMLSQQEKTTDLSCGQPRASAITLASVTVLPQP